MHEKDKRSITSPINGNAGGVKTSAGKSISKMNALKHGILSRYATELDDLTFEEAYDIFAAEFGDTTASRKALISQLAVLHIRLRRCTRFESDFLTSQLNPPRTEMKLIKKGIDFDLGPLSDQYETVVIDPGKPMRLPPSKLENLDTIYMKYEAQFLSRFCHIVEILTQSEK